MKRIAQRNRSVEETIKLDYIEELHNEYNRYFEALQSNESISTFIVNANSSHDGVYEDVLNILRPILIEKSSWVFRPTFHIGVDYTDKRRH